MDGDGLLDRIRKGDGDAATEAFRRFVNRLIALARSRLSPRMQRRVDPEDVVQSAYRSFFRRAEDGAFEAADDELWRLLAAITINKVQKKVEFHTAQKRDVSADASVAGAGDSMGIDRLTAGREPAPEEAAAVVEEMETLMSGLNDRNREIVELRLQGLEVEEISTEIGRSHRTIRRVLQHVREELEARLAGADA